MICFYFNLLGAFNNNASKLGITAEMIWLCPRRPDTVTSSRCFSGGGVIVRGTPLCYAIQPLQLQCSRTPNAHAHALCTTQALVVTCTRMHANTYVFVHDSQAPMLTLVPIHLLSGDRISDFNMVRTSVSMDLSQPLQCRSRRQTHGSRPSLVCVPNTNSIT